MTTSTAPRFDRAALQENVGDDPSLLASLVDLFISSQPPRVHELRGQLERGECEPGAKTAHALVGSFRTMAMPGPGSLAKAVEVACREGRLEDARAAFRLLEPECDALMVELTALRRTLP